MSILDIKNFILENSTCIATMSNKYYLGTRLKTSHLVIIGEFYGTHVKTYIYVLVQ
jgi:hypothetical protein